MSFVSNKFVVASLVWGALAAPSAFASFPASINANINDEFSTSLANGYLIDGVQFSVFGSAFINDLDNDGAPERLVTLDTESQPDSFCRSVYLFPSSANVASSLSASELEQYLHIVSSNSVLDRDSSGICRPQVILNVGDMNGDGIDDVTLHNIQPENETEISIGVVFGTALGATADVTTFDGNNGFLISGYRFNGEQTSESDVESVGDVNGDGFDDLAVRHQFGNTISILEGRSGNFPSNIPFPEGDEDAVDGNFMLTVIGDQGVGRMEPLGDVNGDGFSDLVFGADGYFDLSGVGASPDNFRARFQRRIVYGSGEFTSSDPLIFTYNDLPDTVGCNHTVCALVGLGDINNDGFDDVATFELADDGTETNMQLVMGSSAGVPTQLNSSNTIGLPGRTPNFKLNVLPRTISVDFNGDNIDDLVMRSENEAEVVFGSADIENKLNAITDDEFNGDFPLLNGIDGFGISNFRIEETVWQSGEFNGDGTSDVLFDGFQETRVIFGRVAQPLSDGPAETPSESPAESPTDSEPPSNSNAASPVITNSARYSATAAEISWERQSVAGAQVRYEVRRNGETLTTTDGTSFYDSALPSDASVTYSVISIVGDARSAETSVTVSAFGQGSNGGNDSGEQAQQPLNDDTPSGGSNPALSVTLTEYSTNAAELFWTRLSSASGDAVMYEVRKNGAVVTTTTGTSYFDGSYSQADSGAYSVTPINSDVGSGIAATTGNNASGNDMLNDAPASGGTLAGARGQVYSSTALELFWDRADAQSYNIYQNGALVGSSTGTSFYQDSLRVGTAYAFRIEAINGAGAVVASSVDLLLRTTN